MRGWIVSERVDFNCSHSVRIPDENQYSTGLSREAMDQFSFFGLTVSGPCLDAIMDTESKHKGMPGVIRKARKDGKPVELDDLETCPRINMGGNNHRDEIVRNGKKFNW